MSMVPVLVIVLPLKLVAAVLVLRKLIVPWLVMSREMVFTALAPMFSTPPLLMNSCPLPEIVPSVEVKLPLPRTIPAPVIVPPGRVTLVQLTSTPEPASNVAPLLTVSDGLPAAVNAPGKGGVLFPDATEEGPRGAPPLLRSSLPELTWIEAPLPLLTGTLMAAVPLPALFWITLPLLLLMKEPVPEGSMLWSD